MGRDFTMSRKEYSGEYYPQYRYQREDEILPGEMYAGGSPSRNK
jgi:hypothetical protein